MIKLVIKAFALLGAGIYMIGGLCEAIERINRKQYLQCILFVLLSCICMVMIAGIFRWKT